MKHDRNWIELLTQRMDLPGESIPGQPLLELFGCSRILIERHSGICQYSTERISVKVCYGRLTIHGACLEIRHMSRNQLVISGRIHGIEIQRGDS